MLLVAGGTSFDFLHFINPTVQTLPTSPVALIANPGIVLALVLGLSLTMVSLAAAATGLVFLKVPNLRLASVFIVLFLLSISVVLITTSASETHLYTGNAFLAMASGLVFLVLGEYLFRSNQSYGHIAGWLLVGVILLVLVSRAVGVENRNQILLERSRRSQKLQQQLAGAIAGCQTNKIMVASACQLPQGYSVYGGTGMELFQAPGFAQLSLGEFSIATEIVDLAGLETGQISAHSDACAVVVDMVGNIYRYPERRSEWRCE
jgi:hypothetical protein